MTSDIAEGHKELDLALATIYMVIGFILVGLVDYISGVEIRIYPLYFLPVCLVAWCFGRVSAMTATVIRFVSNWAAGMRFSLDNIWIVNTLSQGLAFATVTALLFWAKKSAGARENIVVH